MSELQATVAAYDETTRAGRVLLDDGTWRDFPGTAVRPEVLRLRPGQRVRLLADGGAVSALTLAGMPLQPPRQVGPPPACRTMGG